MRDVANEGCLNAKADDRYDSAIRGLALMSLLVAKTRQEDRWPCIVRPVQSPIPRTCAALT